MGIPWQAMAALMAGLVWSFPVTARVTVDMEDVVGRPGDTFELTPRLRVDAGERVAGVQMDVTFDSVNTPIASAANGTPDCVVNRAIGKPATAFAFRPPGCNPQRGECTAVRALVLALDNVVLIPSGSVLFRCRIGIAGHAAAGRYPVRLGAAMYSPPEGGDRTALAPETAVEVRPGGEPPLAAASGSGCQTVPGTGTGASPALAASLLLVERLLRRRRRLTDLWRARVVCAGLVERPPPILLLCGLVVLHATEARGLVVIQAASASGQPGDRVMIAFTLLADGAEQVAGIQNDVALDPRYVSVAALADGSPDCTVNSAIGKEASAFGFRPRGCDPGRRQCNVVRAVVLAFDNVDAIPSGAVLYTCAVSIAVDAPAGRYDVIIREGLYSPPPPAAGDLTVAVWRGYLTVLGSGDPGDANCDRLVDPADLAAIERALFEPVGGCQTDCNGDGAVSAADVACVGRRVLSSRSAALAVAARRPRRLLKERR